MNFFAIENTAFEILAYPISYIELIGTLFGLLSVYLASKANVWTWGTGIVNEIFLCILFFQVQLYADMFLQIYFLVVTLYGWYYWKRKVSKNTITMLDFQTKIVLGIAIGFLTGLSGFFFSHIHLYLPIYFKLPATYPFIDSFIMVASMVATLLLANKKIESWYLWFVIDIICVILYVKKEIYFLAFEYLIFLGLATYGLVNWKKQIKVVNKNKQNVPV
jgi:nicotinamide mononucleotide transporter